MLGLGQSWERLTIVSGPSQDSLRKRLGIFWDYLGTDYSTILYVRLGQSQDRLRTGIGLGQDRNIKIEGIANYQLRPKSPNLVAVDEGEISLDRDRVFDWKQGAGKICQTDRNKSDWHKNKKSVDVVPKSKALTDK